MAKVTLHTFDPHPGQDAILSTSSMRNVACMGRRFGKTHLMTEIIINGKKRGALGAGKPTAWYAPNDSYFQNVFKGIARQYAPVIKRAVSSPRPYIEFKNGGSIEFWTLENPMSCGRGNFYSRVIIDEAAHARHLKDAWEQSIEYTLADLNGDAWFISTPYGRNYFWELWQKGSPDNPKRDPAWASFTAPSMDNPHLTPGWMEEKRKTSPERVFAQEVLAQFLQEGAGVFRRVTEAVDHTLGTDPFKADAIHQHSYVFGVDWGRHNDYTVIVVLDVTARAVVAVERFTQIDYAVQLARLQALHQRFPGSPIMAESNSMGGPLIEDMQRRRMPVRAFHTSAASKMEAIESLVLAFEQSALRLPPVQWLIDELMAFDQERLPSGSMRYCAPKGGHDDGVMALAIAWHACTAFDNKGASTLSTVRGL